MKKTIGLVTLAALAVLLGLAAGCPKGGRNDTPARPDFAKVRNAYKGIAARPDAAETRFAVFGDIKDGPEIMEKIVQAVEKDGKYDFLMCVGDMVSGATDERYTAFCRALLRNVRETPFIFVPGNHDESEDSTESNPAQLYEKYLGDTRYSFSVGKTLFVCLDNASGHLPGQFPWLEKLLKDKRDKYDALIVFMHMPPVDTTMKYSGYSMSQTNSEHLMRILKEYRATQVFCGHIHTRFEFNWQGVPIYITGGGGAGLSGGHHPQFHYLEVAVRGEKIQVAVHPVEP